VPYIRKETAEESTLFHTKGTTDVNILNADPMKLGDDVLKTLKAID